MLQLEGQPGEAALLHVLEGSGHRALHRLAVLAEEVHHVLVLRDPVVKSHEELAAHRHLQALQVDLDGRVALGDARQLARERAARRARREPPEVRRGVPPLVGGALVCGPRRRAARGARASLEDAVHQRLHARWRVGAPRVEPRQQRRPAAVHHLVELVLGDGQPQLIPRVAAAQEEEGGQQLLDHLPRGLVVGLERHVLQRDDEERVHRADVPHQLIDLLGLRRLRHRLLRHQLRQPPSEHRSDLGVQRGLREAEVLFELCARRRRQLEAGQLLVAERGVRAARELKQEGDGGLDAHREADDEGDQLGGLAVVALLAEQQHLPEQLAHRCGHEVRRARALVEQAAVRRAEHLLLLVHRGHVLRRLAAQVGGLARRRLEQHALQQPAHIGRGEGVQPVLRGEELHEQRQPHVRHREEGDEQLGVGLAKRAAEVGQLLDVKHVVLGLHPLAVLEAHLARGRVSGLGQG